MGIAIPNRYGDCVISFQAIALSPFSKESNEGLRYLEGEMRRRARTVLSAGVGVVVLLCCLTSNDGWTAPPTWLDQDRFRDLPWGAAVEQAQTIYQDLSFVRYAISDEKETPSKVYERKNEVRVIDGIRVDGILYWFRNNSFCKVTVNLNSKVGPRTITTPAAEAFDKLSDQINGAIGEPMETRIGHGISGTNKKRIWMRGEMSITLLYLEPPGVNDDDLILEIVKRAVGRETPVPE